MAKDKEHKDKEHKKEKKDKKERKVRTSELHSALADPANTSTDIILTPTKKSHDDDEEDLYESRLPAQAAFAKPLANKKLNKKVLKTIKKASQAKELRRGVKEVVKALRKGEKGVVVIAGDISPEDVISHIPVLCEDHATPYIFTPSKLALGLASLTKRPTSVLLVKEGGKENERVEELIKEVKKEMKSVVYYA